MNVRYIKYIGENVLIDHLWFDKHKGGIKGPLTLEIIKEPVFSEKTFLTKNKAYKLEKEWEFGTQINGYWVFYIYDDLEDGTARGFEIEIKDIELIRNHNIDSILN